MTDPEYAFPEQEKEPIGDASHVRNAVARFMQVQDVTDDERDAAWRRIERAPGQGRRRETAGRTPEGANRARPADPGSNDGSEKIVG